MYKYTYKNGEPFLFHFSQFINKKNKNKIKKTGLEYNNDIFIDLKCFFFV